MLHFIPAWYADGTWCEREQHWHARRMHTEFDDTVKHIQLFHRNQIHPFQIMLLSYAPNFRHFLHRQGVFHAPYWSCFDAIQGIQRKKPALLSYHSLKWPEGTEFLYTMFVIVALVDGEKYAKLEFGEDGNLIEIELYRDNQVVRKNIYDDRGFLSSTVVYKGGQPIRQDFLGESGVWRVRHHFADGHVSINPKSSQFRLEIGNTVETVSFQREMYPSMEDLVDEVLCEYLKRTGRQDLFCAAVHPLHMNIIQKRFQKKHLVLSLFEERNSLHVDEAKRTMLCSARHLICDSAEGMRILNESAHGNLPPCTVITPFDTRPDFGISQQMTTQKILVPVDGLEERVLYWTVITLASYLNTHDDTEVHFFTRTADYQWKDKMMEKVQLILENMDMNAQDSENQELTMSQLLPRFFCEQCVDELSVSKCLRLQRLIVDLRMRRDVYLRVIAVSMGIPQILFHPSEFMISGQNGMLLRDLQELPEMVQYYLGELANWNHAMVCAYELGKKFDTASQVEKWKGVIDSFGEDSCSNAGQGATFS